MRHPARCTSWLLILNLLLLSLPLHAVDETLPDPYVSLHPTDNIVALAKLRPLLAKSPDDQHLLGLALMCYVNLSLSGEAEEEGAHGPWLTYANRLAERRMTARGGKSAGDFATAEPELWVRLLNGYSGEVATALAAWPQEVKSPRHLALKVLATTDWRPFQTNKPRTLHERYAALRTGFDVRHYQLLEHLSLREATHNPFLVSHMNWRASRWGDPVTMVREAVSFSAWMLASTDLDDATAMPLLLELGAAVHAVMDPTLSRQECWRRVLAACRRIDEPDPTALGAALVICDRLSAHEHGLIGTDGVLRLYGLGDLAAWNRDRLYLAVFFGYLIERGKHRDFAKTEQAFLAKLRERIPESMIICRYILGYQGNTFANNDNASPAAWDAFATAITQELERKNGHGFGIITTGLSKLAIGRPGQAADLLRRVVADHDGILPRMTLGRLMSTAELCGEVPLILPALRHWSQAAPLDIDLRTALHKWSPDNTMLTLGERKPFRSWRDATIDNRTLPWPNLELSQRFAIRWTGALRIDQPGSYVFATESDDGSRLAIGDVVVDNSGNHAMRIRRMRADLEPGWLPLTLDFAQGGGEAGCRLLWLPPGGTGLVPIPADRLAERADGPAGLVADGFDQTNRPRTGGPNAEQLAYARALPWHLRVQHLTGNELWEANRYPEALTFFRTILEFNPEHHAGRRASQCLLWSDPPEVDGAIALMRKHPDLWANGWELTSTVNLLRRAGRLQEVVDAIGARNSNDILWPYVRGYAALDRGDLRTARDELGKLMGEGGPGDRYMPNAELNLARLDWAVLNRLDGKETDWPEVERGIQRNGGLQPWQELVLDWLSSAAAWEDCVARVPTIKDGEDLYYFQGLVAMTTGDHALAKQRFQEVVTKHPNWMETPTCKALLKWYETQTPESLAKIATAKPIGKPAVKPDKPRPDANDF